MLHPKEQPTIPEFIRKIKILGIKVKLDTNGTWPEVLKACLEEGLLDYVVIDIKIRDFYRRSWRNLSRF
ncbi:MAG: hypothetical protein ACOCM4_05720 [Acetivibrio ethanolgignens]